MYHRLLACSPALLDAISSRFPGVVSDGRLDRKKLGRIVFSDGNALQALNQIAHGAVKAEVLRQLQDSPAPFAVIDAIALFEGGLAELCQYTIAVTAPWRPGSPGSWPGKASTEAMPLPAFRPNITTAIFKRSATSP